MKLAPRYEGPAIISIAGPPDDQHAPVVRQRRRLEETLAGLDDAAWHAPSRCDAWTVQDVVSHVVGVNGFWRTSVTAGVSGAPTRILEGFDPVAVPPLLVEPMRSLTSVEVLEQLVSSNDAFLDALAELDEAAWSMPAETPAGYVPIRVLAHHALWDCWIHERDIALPLGSTPTVEADEVQSCLRYAAALGPAYALTERHAPAGVFSVEASDPDVCFVVDVGQSIAVREGPAPTDAPCLRGGAVELVEALSLRAPLPSSAPVEWRRLVGGLATAFDTELETGPAS